jgi:hypothetical protein
MPVNLSLQRAQFMLGYPTDGGNTAVLEPELRFRPAFSGVHIGRLAPVGTVEQKDPALPSQDRRHGAVAPPILGLLGAEVQNRNALAHGVMGLNGTAALAPGWQADHKRALPPESETLA